MSVKQGVIDSVQVRFLKKGRSEASNPRPAKIIVTDTGKIDIFSLDDKFPSIHLKTANIKKPKLPLTKNTTWISLDIIQNNEAEFNFVNIQVIHSRELGSIYDTLMIASDYVDDRVLVPPPNKKKKVEPIAGSANGEIRRDFDFVDMEKQNSSLKEELKEAHLRSAFLSEQNEKERKKFDDFLAELWMERGRPEELQEILAREMGAKEEQRNIGLRAMEEALKEDGESGHNLDMATGSLGSSSQEPSDSKKKKRGPYKKTRERMAAVSALLSARSGIEGSVKTDARKTRIQELLDSLDNHSDMRAEEQEVGSSEKQSEKAAASAATENVQPTNED